MELNIMQIFGEIVVTLAVIKAVVNYVTNETFDIKKIG